MLFSTNIFVINDLFIYYLFLLNFVTSIQQHQHMGLSYLLKIAHEVDMKKAVCCRKFYNYVRTLKLRILHIIYSSSTNKVL